MNLKYDKIALRVDAILKESLQKMADEKRRTLSDYIRIVLEKHVEDNYVNEEEKSFAAKQEKIKRIAASINSGVS